MGGHAVDRAAHGVLADAEVDVAAGVAPAAAEGALDLVARLGIRGDSKSPAPFMPVLVEGLRSAEPPMKVGTFGKNALNDRLGGFAGGDRLCRRPSRSGRSAVPAVRQLAIQRPLERRAPVPGSFGS